MQQINPNHKNQRKVLRIIGPALLLMGLCFVVIGFVSFFAAFSGNGRPDKFWCVFVGMPVLFVGAVLTKFGYMGKVARYAAGELAPVGKDSFNYLAAGTQSGVADVSEAFHSGKVEAASDSIEQRIRKLEAMLQSGLINADDFEEQKDRILSEL